MWGPEDERRSPNYANAERERRWLVDAGKVPDLSEMSHIIMDDRYIIGTRLRLRRMTHSSTGEKSYKLTKKYESDDPLARWIVTAYLTEAEYAVFAQLPAATLVKHRHHVAEDGRIFNLDIFQDANAGLEMTEIECETDEELRALTPPFWASAEVTEDERYQGGTLAAAD
jgi:CYTH domain-containing protein